MENLKIKKEKPPHPNANANIFSQLTFSWMFGTFFKGFVRDLEIEDLSEPLKVHRSDALGNIFETHWEKEVSNAAKNNKTPSLLKIIAKVFILRNLLYFIAVSVSELFFELVQPFFIGLLVRYFSIANQNMPPASDGNPAYLWRCVEILSESSSRIEKEEALLYAGCLVVCVIMTVLIGHPYAMAIRHQGLKLSVACSSMMYRKALKLSQSSLGETSTGQVVNLLSNDVIRFDTSLIFLHFLLIGPLQTVIISYFMYEAVGWTTFLGVAFLLAQIPFQALIGKKASVYRLRTALRTDERIRLMNEIISGIQVIKMYTWENPFTKLVDKARKKEIKEIRGSSFCRAILWSVFMFSTRFALFLTMLAYVLTGNQMTAEKLFVLTAFYNILRQTMTGFFPNAIEQLAQALVSAKRIEKFMMLEENQNTGTVKFNKENVTINGLSEKPQPPGITFEKVFCQWLPDSPDAALKHINLTITPGKTIAVIGPVGAGKSSLIQAILKELPIKSGNMTVNGGISYASQEPWLFAASIRQNILFGMEYDRHRYQKVVDVCVLKRDFELFPYGDRTIVGEKGVSLSGGQRARINLARAVYKEADIYLLDDPLSAVDAHVGKHLFEDCISGFLRNKTVLLVTHQLQYLKSVHRIVILNNGSIDAEGSFDDLQTSGLDFAKLLHEPKTPSEVENVTEKESTVSINSRKSSMDSNISRITDDEREDPLEVAETRQKGSLGWSVYGSYFKACQSWFLVLVMVLSFILAQLLTSGVDYWGSAWARQEEINTNRTDMTDEDQQRARDLNIYIYMGLNVVSIVVTVSRSFLFFYFCMRASRNLHNLMFSNITCATMRFFHTNPSGRILNRFSMDMGSLDEQLPVAMIDCFQIFLSLLGIITIVASVSPIMLVPTFIIATIFYFLRIFYLRTSRSVKRLEGVTRSPIFSHLSATLQGLTTIRAFGAQKILTAEFDSHQDLHSAAWFLFTGSSRAFGFWLDSFCVLYTAIITFSFLFWEVSSGADAGLAITQALGLMGMFQWGMRQSAELENQMTSVERVLEYTKVEMEPPLDSKPDKKPPPSWPTKGNIEFEKTVLRYDPKGQPVLHGVSFVIKPQEKIGIVGRTGAGKSTLIAALFRLAYIEGKIVIDSVETSEIGLHDLRSKVSIIPQEPVLFSGTLRKNLDPFDEYPDWVLWQALEEVDLKGVVSENLEGLQSRMSQGGTNFSVGQRQLVCLARAIIRNNRILIMDEATANVDPQSDIQIQRTIRRKFSDCTVVTIAHRLNTVMDSDRILVMDAGRVAEFDRPYLLLKQNNSFLSKLVKQTGPSTSKKLKSIARKSHKLILRREEALRMLQDTSSDISDSSRSSSPEPVRVQGENKAENLPLIESS